MIAHQDALLFAFWLQAEQADRSGQPGQLFQTQVYARGCP